jgi:hypothetical protein
MSYNMSVQRAITNNLAATVSYVGNGSRHLSLYYDPNTIRGLFAPGVSTQQYMPFPDLSGIGIIHFGGISNYNALQAKLEMRTSHGLSFLTTYTWAHALDDTSDAGGLSTAIGDRNMALIPYNQEYTNSPYDIRQRVTLNGNYQLPFGRGRRFPNNSGWTDELVGGWSTSLTFAAQTGTPFTVSPSTSTANGGSARAILVRDPFATGGTPDTVNNPSLTSCPTEVRTKANWYNPCSFANPLPGNLITGSNIVTKSTTSDCIPGRAIQPDLWTWIQRREHVAIQKLHYLPRAVSAVPRGRLQPVESSDVGESFEPGNWSTRRTDHKRKVFSEQHAGRAIPAIVSEIQLLETSSRKGRLCSYAPSIFPQRYSRAPTQA